MEEINFITSCIIQENISHNLTFLIFFIFFFLCIYIYNKTLDTFDIYRIFGFTFAIKFHNMFQTF